MFKKEIAEHQDLKKDIALERKENEDMLKQTTMSLESDLENAFAKGESARDIRIDNEND